MESRGWIFVSHSSEDLPQVRKVRNYLEERDASPLLFYLKALTDPQEFWPLIKREIQTRNFFLLCESQNAENSTWVQRERAAVEEARRQSAKRIGRLRVDQPELDRAALDEFYPTHKGLSDLSTPRPGDSDTVC